MNEVQLIRRELAAQRQHGHEIGVSWGARSTEVNSANSAAYNLYFLLIIDLESRRIESHLDRLRSRSDLSDAERRVLARCAREFETAASARMAAATSDSATATAADTVARNVQFRSRLSRLAQELEAIAESHYGVNDWRRASHIEADSILEELRLRKQALGETRGPVNS